MDQGTIVNILEVFFRIYTYMVIGYILMSWFPNMRESSIGQLLGRFVEPILAPFRRIIPPIGMIDISPIVAIIALNLALIGATTLVGWFFRAIGS